MVMDDDGRQRDVVGRQSSTMVCTPRGRSVWRQIRRSSPQRVVSVTARAIGGVVTRRAPRGGGRGLLTSGVNWLIVRLSFSLAARDGLGAREGVNLFAVAAFVITFYLGI